MLKRSQTLLSATFIAFLLIAFLIVSPQPAAACEEPPSTLLRLYLESGLIVIADYQGDNAFVVESDDEYGTWGTIARNLSIVRVIKGQNDLERLSFETYKYEAKPNQPGTDGAEEEEYYEEHDGGMEEVELKRGNRYVFFLRIPEEEGGKYSLTDYYTGVRELSGKYSVNLDRIDELQGIIASRENQLGKLTEWLVKNIEDPVMRYDGLNDLAESFYALRYDSEEENSADADEVVKPFVIDEQFSTYSPVIAASLTDSQKNRISTVLYNTVQEAWFGGSSATIDYSLTFIVSVWDRPRLALYGFNMLQSLDTDDLDKRLQIMEFVANVIEDGSLSATYYDYYELHHAIAEQTKKNEQDAIEELKANIERRDSLSSDFDKRFRFMYGRNFAPVEEEK